MANRKNIRKLVGASGAGAVLIASAALAVLTAPSASATSTLEDCVTHAVYHGEAAPLVALEACAKDSLTGCYRVFHDKYGRQAWALEACKKRG